VTEECTRLVIQHVVVDGGDFDAVPAQGFDQGHLVSKYEEVAGDGRLGVASGLEDRNYFRGRVFTSDLLQRGTSPNYLQIYGSSKCATG
jgi:hypothetical protein